MELPRRKFLYVAASSGILPILSRVASALDYPTRPVHVVVGFPAGYGADITARLISQWLSERLGQQFIVDNRPGAGTNTATETVVRAPSDGYTLLLVTQTNAINTTLYENLDFNFAKDISPVAGLSRVPGVVVVTPSLPTKTLPELIAYAKSNPGKINMASAGPGSFPHVAGELFKLMTGVNMIHVPYRSSYTADLLAGQVQIAFPPIPAVLGLIRTGKLRALAVTSATRSDALPEIPPVGEFVNGYEASAWYGVGAPRGTPSDIVERLNKEINEALADPKLKARFAELDSEEILGTPADFGKLIADETDKWSKVVRSANIKVE